MFKKYPYNPTAFKLYFGLFIVAVLLLIYFWYGDSVSQEPERPTISTRGLMPVLMMLVAPSACIGLIGMVYQRLKLFSGIDKKTGSLVFKSINKLSVSDRAKNDERVLLSFLIPLAVIFITGIAPIYANPNKSVGFFPITIPYIGILPLESMPIIAWLLFLSAITPLFGVLLLGATISIWRISRQIKTKKYSGIYSVKRFRFHSAVYICILFFTLALPWIKMLLDSSSQSY